MTEPGRSEHAATDNVTRIPLGWTTSPTLADDIATGRLIVELVDEDPTAAVDPVEAWGRIFFSGIPSPQRWAWVTSAIHNADNLLAGRPHDGEAYRGDRHWCQQATAMYHALRVANAYDHIPDASEDRCMADPVTVRTWLAAPLPGRGATVNEELDLTDEPLGDSSITVSTAAVDRLLTVAQQAGVFGIADHHIGLHHCYPNGHEGAGLAFVTRPIFGYLYDLGPEALTPSVRTMLDLGSGIPSARIQIHDVLPPDHSGVDAAVTLLTRAADLVNTALHADHHGHTGFREADLVDQVTAQKAHPHDGGRGTPFPPLRLDPTVSATAAPLTPPAEPEHGRHR